MFGMGQNQREKPQDKKPKGEQKPYGGDDDQIEITPVDEILEQLEQVKKKYKGSDQDCGCWGE